MRSRPTGLQLPQSLLDQLNETSGDRNIYVHQPILLNITLDATPTSRHGRSFLHKPKTSRKEARKQSREGKKRRKAEFFSSSTGTSSKRLATSPHPDSLPPKKRTVDGQPRLQSPGWQSEKGLSDNSSRLTSKKTRAVTSSTTPSSRSVTHPTLPRSQQEEDEDRYIALLEKKLTSGKRSKNGPAYLKDIVDDGLGGG
jgi:nucleolar MIF4G domain-containing protein 1